MKSDQSGRVPTRCEQCVEEPWDGWCPRCNPNAPYEPGRVPTCGDCGYASINAGASLCIVCALSPTTEGRSPSSEDGSDVSGCRQHDPKDDSGHGVPRANQEGEAHAGEPAVPDGVLLGHAAADRGARPGPERGARQDAGPDPGGGRGVLRLPEGLTNVAGSGSSLGPAAGLGHAGGSE